MTTQLVTELSLKLHASTAVLPLREICCHENQTKAKEKTGTVAWLEKLLPSMHKALGSIPGTTRSQE